MSFNNGIITIPITIGDLQSALNTSATNVVALCQHLSINKYSRYKPYAFGGIQPNGLYNQAITGMPTPGGPAEQIIRDNNFGMTPTELTVPTSYSMNGVVTKWKSWRPPSGKRAAESPSGVDEPCRMGDFAGYDKNAIPYIENYEIFGTFEGSLVPVRNGLTGVRLKINSKSGVSILPSEFSFDGIDFADTKLTIVIANVEHTNGRYLCAQSEKHMLDADIESFWNTATKKGTLEAIMDLTQATDAQINDFLGGKTKLFIGVGLAEEIDPSLGETVGNAIYIKTNQKALPFKLINFNMWDKPWVIATLYDGFQINGNSITRFDLPCSLTAPTNCDIKWNASTKEIEVDLRANFIIGTDISGLSSTIQSYKNYCNLGVEIRVDISDMSGNPLTTFKYGAFASDGFDDQRTITPTSDGVISTPPFSYGAANIQYSGCLYFGLNQLPTGTAKIPYSGSLKSLWVDVSCSVICFPFRDTAGRCIMPVPTAIYGGYIERTIRSTQISIS